jgi:hypothetical protein
MTEARCRECGSTELLRGDMVQTCLECGLEMDYYDPEEILKYDMDTQNIKWNARSKYRIYKFKKLMERYQCNEAPEYQYTEYMKKCLEEQSLRPVPKVFLKIIKKMKNDSLYEFIPYFFYTLNHLSPPTLTITQKEILLQHFNEILQRFELKKQGRNNFPKIASIFVRLLEFEKIPVKRQLYPQTISKKCREKYDKFFSALLAFRSEQKTPNLPSKNFFAPC